MKIKTYSNNLRLVVNTKKDVDIAEENAEIENAIETAVSPELMEEEAEKLLALANAQEAGAGVGTGANSGADADSIPDLDDDIEFNLEEVEEYTGE